MQKGIVDFLSSSLNSKILNVSPISGGCINECYKLTTNSESYFIKLNRKFNPFVEEQKGLDILRATRTFFIPKVLLIGKYEDYSFLLMEYIESENQTSNFWNDFGKKLAALHKISNESFGFDHNNYIGSLQQINTWHANSIEFFINCRLIPQLELLNDINDNQFFKSFDALFNILNEILPEGKPSLLHGDLWSGNYMVGKNGNPAIVDPAVYYGFREADIAMSKLFGGFANQFYDTYNETFPLEINWQSRVQVWNLYPLLVHANLFGSSYLNQVKSIIKNYI